MWHQTVGERTVMAEVSKSSILMNILPRKEEVHFHGGSASRNRRAGEKAEGRAANEVKSEFQGGGVSGSSGDAIADLEQ